MNAFKKILALSAPAIFALGASPLFAQQAVRTLSKPDAEFSEPFSQVIGVRELKNGRVVVADFKDKSVQLLDFKAGTASKIGREGAGPGEFSIPLGLFALPNDTSMIYDPLNQRYLAITPDGKPGATFRLESAVAPKPPAANGGEQRVVLGGSSLGSPRFTDARGRVYFEGQPFAFGPNGPTAADSAAIIRFDRITARAETLAYVQLAKNDAEIKTTGTASNRNVSMKIGSSAPFAARDEWGVLPDGRIVIARVKDYHVDVVQNLKQKVAGSPVQFAAVKIGEAEKNEWREAARKTTGIAMTRTVGGSGASSSGTTALPPPEEPATWPAVKPAFVGRSLFTSPTGETWILRTRRATDHVPTFDVFDTMGKLTGKVVLPPKTRLVGFGSATAYAVRIDDDDLQYLMQYQIGAPVIDAKAVTPIPLTRKPG